MTASAETGSMNVPLIKPDLPAYEELEGPFREILANGKITNFQKYVRLFEEEAGAYLGTEVVTVSSGTMGLLFTLLALGLQPGQKVAMPSFTFMATAQAAAFAGAVPVFVEVEEDLTMSRSDLESVLAQHDDVGAIVPVHMYGLPARVHEIEELAARYGGGREGGIPVVYDAAHGFGSRLDGAPVGSFGAAEVFSLSVTKILVSVEGGMVSTRRHDLADRLRKMRNYGIESSYNAVFPGLNGKMSEFHAIVGLQNLRRLDALMDARQEKARRYAALLRGRTGLEIASWPENVRHTLKDFTIILPEELRASRDAMIAFLGARGIETRAYFFPPVHEQGAFRRFADRPLPRTENLSRRVITLPFFTTMTDEQMEYVVDAVAAARQALA